MTTLDQDPDLSTVEEGSAAAGPSVPPPPRLKTTSTGHPPPPLAPPSSSSSLLLLSTSTTDPSLFSFDLVKRLNQAHLASIPPNPFSAISVAQHQQKARRPPLIITPSTSADTSMQGTAVPNSAASSDSIFHHQQRQLGNPSDPEGRSSNSIPISQLRRASAPVVVSPHRPQQEPPSKSSENSQQASELQPSSRLLSSQRRSLDDLSLRRIAESSTDTSNQTSSSKGQDSKMTATLGYGSSDYYSGFTNGKYGSLNSDDASFLASFQQGRRPTVVQQTRELYLHPSQIFTPDGTSNNDISGYFSSTFDVNGNHGSGLESTIALPPMLTLEEIIQPHVFTKSEPVDLPFPSSFGATNVTNTSPTAFSNMDGQFPSGISGTTSFNPYPGFSQNESQQSWYGPDSQLELQGEMYSSYLPPDSQTGFSTEPSGLRRNGSPSLQHARDIMAFSERVAMPPMPKPAPGSQSPSSLSAGSKLRDGSPCRSTTRDGLNSQRSDTPHEAIPQKRSGKLPASVTTTLKNWLLAHTQHPYPTEEEKRTLCSDTGLTMNQVSNWFINARRRILPNLGNVAMSGNRKQLTQYNPPGPRRAFPQARPHGYPPYHGENEGMFHPNATALSAARMRSHPYANYGPPPPHVPHGYNYQSEIGPY